MFYVFKSSCKTGESSCDEITVNITTGCNILTWPPDGSTHTLGGGRSTLANQSISHVIEARLPRYYRVNGYPLCVIERHWSTLLYLANSG